MLIKKKLQHGNFLTWNLAEFWIFIQNIIFQKLKNWLFVCHMFTSLGKNHCWGKPHDIFVSSHNKFDWKFTRDYAKICQLLSEQVHSQYFSGCKSISMEGVALDHFNKLKLSIISMAKFHSHLYDESYQYDRTNATDNCILFYLFLQKKDISILDNHVVSHGLLQKAVPLCIRYVSTIMSRFKIFYYYLQISSSTCTCKRCVWWYEL